MTLNANILCLLDVCVHFLLVRKKGQGGGVPNLPKKKFHGCKDLKTLNNNSTLKYLSFEVLNGHSCQHLDFTPFRGPPFFKGANKWVQEVQMFYVCKDH